MSKKNGSSNRMTIEQIRTATLADVKRIAGKPPVNKSPKKHKCFGLESPSCLLFQKVFAIGNLWYYLASD